MANKITDTAAAAAIPGGVGNETKFKGFVVKVSHQIVKGKDPDSGGRNLVNKNQLVVKMKATTGDYFGFERAKDFIKTEAAKGNRVPIASQGKSYVIVLKKKAKLAGSSKGVATLAMPVPGYVSIGEFFDLIEKLPKNKGNVEGFRTPNGVFYGV